MPHFHIFILFEAARRKCECSFQIRFMFGEMRVAKALSCDLYADTADDTEEQVGGGEQEGWARGVCMI